MFRQKTCTNPNRFIRMTWKSLFLTGIFIFLIIYMSLHIHPNKLVTNNYLTPDDSGAVNSSPTNISHLFFGIAGSSKAWNNRKWYVQSWWRPNITRGIVFMDESPIEHLPWPKDYPPFRVSKDNSRYKNYDKHGGHHVIRVFRVIEETFNIVQNEEKGVRWYVMGDDDTVFLVDNLVRVLSKYDHNKHFYIGMNSECVISNSLNSFEMAFGGGGYALSYPLAKAMAKNIDLCIKRYPNTIGSDRMLQSCVADMGVSLTQEKGFHQIDFHRDISGFLSAHPHSPFISIHHPNSVDPIFPSMNRIESINHLMRAASIDQSRLLQQSICYHKGNNWTFSVSWGYSIQIYEKILPPSFLIQPVETFIPWLKGASPPYMFNYRRIDDHGPNSNCDAPHLFYFDSNTTADHEKIVPVIMDHIITSYTRGSSNTGMARQCNISSGDHISRIRVISPSESYKWQDGSRRECCDVVQVMGRDDTMEIKLRDCEEDEIV